ncbi:MAG TPA: hypothetical protein VFS43_41720 [Polyangiaceae bacterium]|nr:hypothetical protein [Polyangiaceae bacterium]
MSLERKAGIARAAGAALGAALALVSCGGGGSGGGGEGGGPAAGEPPPGGGPAAGVASKKARLKFRGGDRLVTDLAEGLGLPRAEVCNELGAYDCSVVHKVVLGGVEPYRSTIYEPVPRRAVPSALAVDRLALAACDRRARLDFEAPSSALVFGELAADPQLGDAAVGAVAARLYERLLRRAPNDGERAALAGFARELAAELGAEAPRRFATLGCFAVATTAEALFY